MSIFDIYRVRKKLDAVLGRIESLDEKRPPELTVEEAGILCGFIRGSQEAGRLSEEERELIKKIEWVLEKWQRSRKEEEMPRTATGKTLRTQVVLRSAVNKLTRKLYHEMTGLEYELARGTLVGLRACRHKGPRTDRLIDMLSEGLDAYKRHTRSEKIAKTTSSPEFMNALYAFVTVLLILAVGIAGCQYITMDPPAPDQESPAAGSADNGAAAQTAPPPVRRTSEEQALETIREHQQDLSANPDSEDAPALLFAMGNLYRQKLQDYKAAAGCYEKILIDYPDWNGLRSVFPQLEVCFDRMNDQAAKKWLYTQMMENFPEDSQEHLYAKAQLDL